MSRKEDPDRAAPSDEDLAQALKQGNVQAFEELVLRHQGRVYAVAYRITLNREDALDVAQDTFLKAYRKIHRWKPTGGFLPWLLRMTTNQAIDQVRRRKRLVNSGTYAARPGIPEGPRPAGPEKDAQAHEIAAHVEAALEVLSPTQRTVFVMRHYEGMPLADIAEVLGCTVGSVKVHLFRALRKLQKRLDHLYRPPDKPGAED